MVCTGESTRVSVRSLTPIFLTGFALLHAHLLSKGGGKGAPASAVAWCPRPHAALALGFRFPFTKAAVHSVSLGFKLNVQQQQLHMVLLI